MLDKIYNKPDKYEKEHIESIRRGQINPKGRELPKDIARGRVVKTLVYEAKPVKAGDTTEISILYLDPGSEILKHKHTVDREVYYVDGVRLACEAGQSHGYKNQTDKVVTIVAIKQAV